MGEKQAGGNLTRWDEKRLLRIAAETMKSDFPNPQRLGCPESTTLKAVARHRLSVPDADDVIDHVATCAPCFDEYSLYRRRHSRRRAGLLGLICAASLVVGGAVWHFATIRPSARNQPIAQEPPAPVLAATLDFQNTTTERSGEGQRPSAAEPPHLKRALLKITIKLPLGTEDGIYAVQFRTRQHQPVASSTGNVAWDGSAEILITTIDLRKLAPGEYTLAIRKGESSWHTFRVFLD